MVEPVPGRGAVVTGRGARGAASRTGRGAVVVVPPPNPANAFQSIPDRSGNAGAGGGVGAGDAFRAIESAVPVRAGVGVGVGVVGPGRVAFGLPGDPG